MRLEIHRALVFLIVSFTAVVSGCTLQPWRKAGEVYFIGTEADRRLVFAAPNNYEAAVGRIMPTQIICAEPSPDVAKAIAESKALAGALKGSGAEPRSNVQVQGEGSASYSSSRAESLAQLTNRMATIQLLRDGLYRACEAYANGAISATMYAVILSRYDDTMITMLLGELTAGNFGQELAVLGTAAGGVAAASTGSSQDAAAAQQKADAEKAKVETAQRERKSASDALRTCVAGRPAEEPDKCSGQENELREKERALQDAEFNALLAATAAGATSAVAATRASSVGNQGVGGIVGELRGTNGSDPGAHLKEMHRNYIQNINFDSLGIACISALDRDYKGERTYPTLLAELCTRNLEEVIASASSMLEGKLSSAQDLRLVKALLRQDSPLGDLEAARALLKKIETQIGTLTKQLSPPPGP